MAEASLDIPITDRTADAASSSDLQPVHGTRSACSTLHRVSPTTPGRQHSVKQRLPTVETTYLVAYWNVGCCTNGLALVHKVLLFLTYPGSLTGVQGRFWLQDAFPSMSTASLDLSAFGAGVAISATMPHQPSVVVVADKQTQVEELWTVTLAHVATAKLVANFGG